jgi:hypothetical protein
VSLVDRTAHAPTDFRGRIREPGEVDLAVLHQTAVGRALWDEDSTAWDRVRAHLVVLPSGAVHLNHDPLVRLRYGSRWWNTRAVTIEIAGNYPTRLDSQGRPVWWSPERMGQDRIEDAPEQVHAARAVLAWLRSRYPSIRLLGAHRQIEQAKAGCPGPSVWREVGEFALRELGFELVPTDPRGLDIPTTWRAAPLIPAAPGASMPGQVPPLPAAPGAYPGPVLLAPGAKPPPSSPPGGTGVEWGPAALIPHARSGS